MTYGPELKLQQPLVPPLIGAITRFGVILGWYDISLQIGIFAVIIIFLIIQTTWRTARQSEKDELRARSAFDLSEQINERLKQTENEQRFLAEVSVLLASSLNYEDTLKKMAELVVTNLADFCIVEITDDNGEIQRLEVAARDPSSAWVRDLLLRIPLERKRQSLLAPLIATRKALLIEHLTPEIISSLSHELNKANLNSLITVPLIVHDKIMGAIALASSTSFKVYSESDLRLVEELALRAAIAIRNAQLFSETKTAVKVREEVLAIVSHDLKNPLTAIMRMIEQIKRTKQEDFHKIDDYANRIQRSVYNMQILINDLLDFAKIQSGTFVVLKLRQRPIDVITPVIELIKPQIEAKGQNLEIDISPMLPEVACESHRINQVLSNILGNAIKFTPNGGTISVKAKESNEGIVISVSDTGPGIPAEQLPMLFKRYWQAEETKDLGTGLGLSIAKGIVEAHGARIWAESPVGKGSSFYFIIPLATTETKTE